MRILLFSLGFMLLPISVSADVEIIDDSSSIDFVDDYIAPPGFVDPDCRPEKNGKDSWGDGTAESPKETFTYINGTSFSEIFYELQIEEEEPSASFNGKVVTRKSETFDLVLEEKFSYQSCEYELVLKEENRIVKTTKVKLEAGQPEKEVANLTVISRSIKKPTKKGTQVVTTVDRKRTKRDIENLLVVYEEDVFETFEAEFAEGQNNPAGQMKLEDGITVRLKKGFEKTFNYDWQGNLDLCYRRVVNYQESGPFEGTEDMSQSIRKCEGEDHGLSDTVIINHF